MAKSAHRDRGTGDRRLARLLSTASPARVVQRLSPEVLHQLVRHRGLDACADLIVHATSAQLTALMDLDLWRSARPGLDEVLDRERFGEWVAALIEVGEAVAARTVASLERPLVVAALSRHIRVFDPGVRETPDHPGRDLGGYIVTAIDTTAWDPIVSLLLAMSDEAPDAFHEVMAGCRRLSDRGRELDGLDDLLAAPDQLAHDAALAREERRDAQGYVSPADARAFLQSARLAGPDAAERPRAGSVPLTVAVIAGATEGQAHHLAYLANVLMAGCSLQGRPFTPEEASNAATSTCRLGQELDPHGGSGGDGTLLHAFRVGWSALHRRVSLPAAARLRDALLAGAGGDTDTQAGMRELARTLATVLAQETPWLAHDVLDVVAVLDLTAWTALLGVFSECPVIPAALRALVDRSATQVSATEFEFISSAAHLDVVRLFLERLPDYLA